MSRLTTPWSPTAVTLLIGWTLATSAPAHRADAQVATDSAVSVSFSAFVDTYFAYDFNRPRALDRVFTTQAARHNEFNVNLAHIAAALAVRGCARGLRCRREHRSRSTTPANPAWAHERRGLLSRHIQEATVGVQVAPRLWLDGGIFWSHMGSESFISHENLTYTRSLVAEGSPYYQAGAKLTWEATPTVVAQLNVVNGWQNISETNGDKSVGARVDWSATPQLSLSAYNYIGNDAAPDDARQLRIFHGASAKVMASKQLTLQGTVDFGTQDVGDEWARWYGGALIARLQTTPTTALVARVERYADPEQLVFPTGTSRPFKVSGGSLGVDVAPTRQVVWRTELRTLAGPGAIFPDRTGLAKSNTVLVTSLGVRF
ncbi:MAG: porin [Gemmatimonadetes bacterium]|nr:porin [Gemmatimonadota bacterium]